MTRLELRSSSTLLLLLLLGLTWSSALARRQLDDTEDVEEEEVSDFICPEKFGYYPDASNCSRYHICDHGKATDKACDDGLVFSTILKTCDWPYNVQCNLANGNRGDYTGRSLRLKNEDSGDENHVDIATANRRQPVLAHEDDSYWLGRPLTSLSLPEEDYTDHYIEPVRIISDRTRQPANQPQHRRQPVREEPESDGEEEEVEAVGPWFHSLNFDQVRREKHGHRHTPQGRVESNQSTSSTAVTTTTRTTPSPSPVASTNQRGGSGWGNRGRTAARTASDVLPGMLPRKAVRVEEEVLLTDSPQRSVEQNYRNNALQRNNARDSYRLVTHNQPVTTTQWTQPPTTPPPTTLPELAKPQLLGTSVRRRVRVQRRPEQQSTTVTAAPTTTARPPTTERQLPWNSARVDPLLVRNHANNRETGSFRRTVPLVDSVRTFERKPVLREPEESEDGSDDNEEDNDSFYFAQPIDIRKKSARPQNDDLTPRAVAKEVANAIDTPQPVRRTKPNRVTVTAPPSTPVTRPPPTPRVNPESIFQAFNLGFHAAVNPNMKQQPTSFQPPPSTTRGSSTDMEYEDVENEDEDENVDEAEGGDDEESPSEEVNRPNNKEIVVRYDDETEDSAEVTERPPRRNATRVGSHARHRPITTTVPRTNTPTPPRLTQFVDLFINKQNATASRPAPFHSTPDLNTPHRSLNSPRTVNLGLVPRPMSNSSYSRALAAPLPPLPTVPLFLEVPAKPPRSTEYSYSKPSSNKKVKAIKKQVKISKSDLAKMQKKLIKSTPPKSLRPSGHYQRAKRCTPEICRPPNCRCGGTDIPGGFAPKDTPQIVLLTFDDSVNDLNREIYRRLFEENRRNPNGCPIRATFYVSHEWTDYSQVQNLYSKGHEIASHSISHSFGEKFSKERWLSEIHGQREIMQLYAGVDQSEIRGMRAPFLQTGGNTMFEMLHEANFSYDSSMPVYDIDPPYWPYTLDYTVNHDCMIEPCPTNSYPGFWEVGMVMWEDLRGGRCSMADGCFNPSDEEGVYEMVKANFLRHYRTNRSPFGMYFHSRWFLTDHNMKGFIRFLDEMLQLNDVYLVTNWQMIQWMRHPTPLSKIKNFAPFGCDDIRYRPPPCKAPHTCKVRFRGEMRTLRTCQSCPRSYPWTGNNGLEPPPNHAR